MRLGVDIDGVVADYNRALKEFVKRSGSVFRGEEIDVGGHIRSYYSTGRGYPGLHTEFVKAGGYSLAEPLEGAIETLARLAREHRVCFVTSRLHADHVSQSVTGTAEWLARRGVPFHELHILGSSRDKGLVECDVYIDDTPAVVERLAKAGKEAYLFENEYNKGHPICQGVVVVGSWQDIEARLTRSGRS